ncbi:OmpA family protein, partial [Thermodesulfobacteriota bacterium]
LVAIVFTLVPGGNSYAGDCETARKYFSKVIALKSLAERRYVLDKAVKLCPDKPKYLVALAECLERMAVDKQDQYKGSHKKNDQSEKAFQEYNNLLDEAAAVSEKALELKEDNKSALMRLGRIYYLQGRYKMSENAFQQVRDEDPFDKRAQDLLRAVQEVLAGTSDGFRAAKDIISHAKEAAKDKSNIRRRMGIASHTAVRDRQRFNNILFDTLSYKLSKSEAIKQLNEIGKALASKDLEDFRVVIEGHTDNRGGRDLNMKLSRDRANAVKEYLIEKHDLNDDRISLQGFGFDRPRAPNDSKGNMAKNRRVEVLFTE